MVALPPKVLFGAAYYPEYHPRYGDRPADTSPQRLAADLDLMAEARFSVVRVGESVWSTWEPDEGVFDLDWLAPVLDGAHERGISVVLGTPTYAVPPWLARLHPEVAGESATGRRIPWGARQEVDLTSPAFRFHAERVVRRIAARYADHPAVIGWQVDNEPGLHLLHNRGVFQRFVDSLRRTYGDVETLNREWGLVYWSHRLTSWDDLWTPDGNAQPQYDLAWRRFQAVQVDEFIGWQADLVREHARPDQFVTTCLSYERPAVDDAGVTGRLDVTAGNPYYTMQDGLQLPAPVEQPQGWTSNGTWALYESADRMFSSRQEPFLVTETDAQAIGMPWVNRPGYDGQWRQAAWALVSRGASMVEYWHWHTLHFGAETHWGGVLPHSGRPGRVYREIARLGAELESAGELVAGLVPDADVAFVWSNPSRWALQGSPALSLPGTDDPDPRSYQGIVDPFYRGAFEAGLQTRFVHDGQLAGADPAELAARHPVLVAAGLYVADDPLLDLLVGYAAAGGHLVLGPRTGYADPEARARTEVAPGRLAGAAGAWYDEFTNLVADVPVRAVDGSPLTVPAGAVATRWADGLQPDEAAVLLAYDDPHLGRWPAVTTREHRAGRVTVVGTLPGPSLAAAIFRWLVPAPAWHLDDPRVTCTGATARDGRRLRFVHNWSWGSPEVAVPAAVRDVLTGKQLASGDGLRLAPWDVRVLEEG